MKLYIKKDYWYYKEGVFAITYKTEIEKQFKYLIHYLLNKFPVRFYYVGKKFKQKANQPTIRRSPTGQISKVLPYSQSGIWGLFEQLQKELGSSSKTVKAKIYFHEYECKPLTWTIYKLRRQWLNKLKGYK